MGRSLTAVVSAISEAVPSAPRAGGAIDQDPYWMTLMQEYRAYHTAHQYWSRGEKGIEQIMKLPERQRNTIIDLLVAMRKAQGLEFDEAAVLADMRANDPVDEDDY